MKDFLGKFLFYFLVLGFIVAFGGVMEYIQKKSHTAEIVEIEDEEIVLVKKIKRKPASVSNNYQPSSAPMERGLTQSSSSSGFSGAPFSPEPPADENFGLSAGSPPLDYAINPSSFVDQGYSESYGGSNGNYSPTSASGSSAKASTKTSGPASSGITSTIIPGLGRNTASSSAGTVPAVSNSGSGSSGSGSSVSAPVDTAPVALSIAVADLNEDTDSGLLTLSYTDAENHPATSCQITSLNNVQVAQSCSCSAGICTVKVKSAADFNGAGSFSYSVTANGKISNVVSQTVNFLAVNDAPVIAGFADMAIDEDSSYAQSFSITDVDNTLNCNTSVSVTSSDISVVPVANVVFSGTAPNCIATVTPSAGMSGNTTLTLQVNDGTVSTYDAADVVVADFPDAPVATNFAIANLNEDTESPLLTLAYTDTEGDLATSCTVSALSHITVTQACACAAGVCTLKIKGTADYNGAAGFSYTVTANSQTSNVVTETLTILPVNDAPVLSSISNVLVNEEVTTFVNFDLTDVDNTLTCSGAVSVASTNTALIPVANVAITGTAPNCTATITPATDESGSSTITLTATDGTLTDTSSFNVTVTDIDDAPVASAVTIADFDEDVESALITLSYTDVEGHQAGTCSVTDLTNITVTQACACGLGVCSLKVKGAPNYNGAASFKYTVTANLLQSNEVTQTMTILPVNDAPVISVIADTSTNEDQTKFVNFSITDVDSTLTCAGSVTKASSDLVLIPVANITIAGTAPSCTATIVPAANKFGASDITLTVSDTLLTADETFKLTVNQLADDAVSGNVWDFDAIDAGDFSSNPLIAFLAGKAYLLPLDQTDDDADAAGFAAGTAYGVAWDSGKEALTLANANGCNPYEPQDIYQHVANFLPNVIAAYHLDGVGAISDTQNMVSLVGPTLTTAGAGASFQPGRLDEGVQYATGMRMATPDFSSIHKVDGEALTVMAWIKPSFNGGNYQQILANRDSAPIFNWMLYQHMDNGELSFHGGMQFKSNYVPRNDEWIHVIVTVSTTGVSKMYVNGDLKHTENSYIYAQAGTSQKLVLGGRGDPAEDFFDGMLDDVIILGTEISQSDVRKIYDQTSMRYEDKSNGTIASCLRLRDSWTPRYEKVIGYWPMEEVRTEDARRLPAVSGPNMRVTNSGANFEVVEGKLGSALRFKTNNPGGALDNVLLASNDTFGNFGTKDFTIQFWAKFTNNGDAQYIISKRAGCGHESFWNIALQPSNHIRVELDHDASATNYVPFGTDNPVPMDRWTMISLVREGGDARLFVDGQQDASISFPATLNLSNNTPFRVGDITCSGGRGFQGDLDELSVWDAALTASEIKQIYERQSAAFGDSSRQGVFISRVFAAANGQTWSTFLMKSLAPFGKELTATNESTAFYSDVETNLMDDIQAIWHMNESSGNIQDSGPYAQHGTSVNGSVAMGLKGKLGKAARFDGVSYGSPQSFIQGPMNTAALVDYTISAWVTHKSVQEWATIFSTNVTTVSGAALGMQGTSNRIGMNNVGAGSENVSVDLGPDHFNKWIFVTARMVSGTLTIDAWLDGQHLTSSGAVAFGANNTSGQFYIGRHFSSDAQFWNGLIDEVAVWSRGLSNAEIQQLYLRGASRTKIQVKKCTTANCADTDWVGPDGKPGSYFSEFNNNSNPVNGTGSVLLPSASFDFSNFVANGFTLATTQYFQYRLIFETDSLTQADSPNVEQISVGPNHYPTSAPSIEVASGFDFLSLSSFTFTTNCTGLKVQLSSDDGSTWKWHNGAGWVASDGSYLEASNVATIQSNISTFSGPGKLKWRAFMGSDGANVCELDHLNIGGGI